MIRRQCPKDPDLIAEHALSSQWDRVVAAVCLLVAVKDRSAGLEARSIVLGRHPGVPIRSRITLILNGSACHDLSKIHP